MGCTATKLDGCVGGITNGGGSYNCFHPNKPVLKTEEELEKHKEEFHDQYQNAISRVSAYQKESYEYLNGLFLSPKSLLPESLKFGYISASAFFNVFHAGFCGPYIANPNYLLLVDFRTREEHDEARLFTSVHYESLTWDMVDSQEVADRYSVVVFYDHDGTAAANVLSVLQRAYKALKKRQVEDVFILLGGFSSVSARFPHLVFHPPRHKRAISPPSPSSSPLPELRGFIPWMPTLVGCDQLFLGRHEQAEAHSVVCGLGLTHILSIGRSPEHRFHCVTYLGLDGEKNLLETLEASGNIIQSVIDNGGRILVHGVEGLNRSAAVIMAHLMKSTPCILEDAYFYMQVLRPFIRMDDECLENLLRYEKLLFGSRVTDLDELWM